MTMAESLLPGQVEDIIAASKPQIAEAVKPEIIQMLGGVFA